MIHSTIKIDHSEGLDIKTVVPSTTKIDFLQIVNTIKHNSIQDILNHQIHVINHKEEDTTTVHPEAVDQPEERIP